MGIDMVWSRRGLLLLSATVLFLSGAGVVFPEGHELLPSLGIYLPPAGDEGRDPGEVSGVLPLLETLLEGSFRESGLFRLRRERGDGPPVPAFSPGVDAVVAARAEAGPGGDTRVELELFHQGRSVWIQSREIPSDGRTPEVFPQLFRLVSAAREELEGYFPDHGRLLLRNHGVPGAYAVYAGGRLLGHGLEEVILPAGEHRLELWLLRGDIEYPLVRRTVQIAPGELLEVHFALQEDAGTPGISFFGGLSDPWYALFDLRAALMIPLEGFEEFSGLAAGGFATVLFNDLLFRHHVLGVEAGFISFDPDLKDSDDPLDATLEAALLLLTTGISFGPVPVADMALRGGAGVAMTNSSVRDGKDGGGVVSDSSDASYKPAFSTSLDIGIGLGKTGRFSISVGYYGIYDKGDIFSFLGLGLGLGARF
ncbi:hypothetical protein [Alkalispirochaeta alkalica]|uniref:hypothetical protein n=1 Tax=Alkalispirochaeta alkalica TaxID=46356 RepID=UPI000380C1B7|nr:hypothetical protein [Alkalispirochaeta alkalica]